MSQRSVEHATFALERTYDASPDRVFAAWADSEAKARWFDDSETEVVEHDFRVGGWERRRGKAPDGRAYSFQALYQDIVPSQRIVYTYDMLVDGTRFSVSVATVELRPERDRTRLVYTEQSAFLDGHEPPAQREQGMGSLLDALGTWLQSNRSDSG
jgi:uncharacterized protein YndB with AHSA1/START domain